MHWIALTESFSFKLKEKNWSSVEVHETNLHKGVYVCMVRLKLWSMRSDTGCVAWRNRNRPLLRVRFWYCNTSRHNFDEKKLGRNLVCNSTYQFFLSFAVLCTTGNTLVFFPYWWLSYENKLFFLSFVIKNGNHAIMASFLYGGVSSRLCYQHETGGTYHTLNPWKILGCGKGSVEVQYFWQTLGSSCKVYII